MRAIAALALLASACGGAAWTASDTKATTGSVLTFRELRRMCTDDDAGGCFPASVRALSRSGMCLEASKLYSHGAPIPDDAGGGCAHFQP